MKILVVCSRNSGHPAPFIQEQVESLQSLGIETDYFFVQQKGCRGYLKERKGLLRKMAAFQPQIIHAHYGLSGLLANLQLSVPVVTTYHGSDINNAKVYPFSRLCMILSAHNIFVSEKNRSKVGIPHFYNAAAPRQGFWKKRPFRFFISIKEKQSLLPCGVNLHLFGTADKQLSRQALNLDANTKYVLFAGAFTNAVKNPDLARAAVALLPDVRLLELRGYTRQQVVMLMNAVDVALMTSFTEGSPQFIKEAMACNCPIVSVAVGDVEEVMNGLRGCILSSYDPVELAEKIKQALQLDSRTEGRRRIMELKLDTNTVAEQILTVYTSLI